MYMWKNIFHVIPMWHRDIIEIFCPHHQNIPKISIPTHRLTLTLTCLLHSIVVVAKVKGCIIFVVALVMSSAT